MQAELEKIETLYAELETSLEMQYRDLLAGFSSNPSRGSDSFGLDARLLDAERMLTRLISSRSPDVEACGTDHPKPSHRAARLLERAKRLQELVERNAAECRRLQETVRNACKELHVGGQFLNSMRGYRDQPPKYVDARQ